MAISMRRRLEIIRWKCCKLFLGDWFNWMTIVKWLGNTTFNFQRPVKKLFPKRFGWNLADEIMVTNHYGAETFKQNRTINTASVAVWNIWHRQFYTAKHPCRGNRKFRVFIETLGKTARRTLSTSSQTPIVPCVHSNQCWLTDNQKRFLTLQMHFNNNGCIDCKRY